MIAESSYLSYDFWHFARVVNLYKGLNFVYIFIIEYIIFLVLGLYFFYIIPHEIGIA